MTFATWLTFFAACWAISISPGSGAISAMSAGLRYGFTRGYWNNIGLIGGILFQLIIVSVGLGALLAASEIAFNFVKWAGVAYLLYLGLRQIRSHALPVQTTDEHGGGSIRALLTHGFLVNASNPKGTVFLLAIVPQFINPALPQLQQYAIIGATLAFTDIIVMGLYTLLAARLLRVLRSPSHIDWMNRIFGGLFVLAAVWLATFRRTG